MKLGTTVFTVAEYIFECDRKYFCDVVKLYPCSLLILKFYQIFWDWKGEYLFNYICSIFIECIENHYLKISMLIDISPKKKNHMRIVSGSSYFNKMWVVEEFLVFPSSPIVQLSLFWVNDEYISKFWNNCKHKRRQLWIMILNVTMNNVSFILWLWVLLMAETRRPGENHKHYVGLSQT